MNHAQLLNSKNHPIATLTENNAQGMETHASQTYVRTYCIGGLTSVDYAKTLVRDIRAGLTSLVLSDLSEQRQKIFKDDHAMSITPDIKNSTLVIEWSGANDLITVRDSPTYNAAKNAVEARIGNLKELIKHGYKHFILFNLPDLSLTPRFQRDDEHDRRHAQDVVKYFNQLFSEQLNQLQRELSESVLIIQYDVNQLFTSAYNDPDSFDIDLNKLGIPLVESDDFRNTDNPDAAKGYMFWDDVHPTQLVHHHLASDFLVTFKKIFSFSAPVETRLQQFRAAYGKLLISEQGSFFKFFGACITVNRFDYNRATLEQIFDRAVAGDDRVLEAMRELNWIDQDKSMICSDAAIIERMGWVQQRLQHKGDKKRPSTVTNQVSLKVGVSG